MKNNPSRFSLLFILLLLKINVVSQWQLQNSGTGNNLESIFFLDSLYGWACGYGMSGTILKTTDGGINWIEIEYLPDDWLTSVYFTGIEKGWIVGEREISIYDHRGIILHTVNGGISWDEIEIPDQSFYSVHFVNDSVGWVGGSSLLHTINEGEDWIFQISCRSTLRELFFINPDTGWFVGNHGYIAKSENGGYNWTVQQSGTESRLWSIDFVDTHHGWISGDSGTILKTTDGGLNWIKMSTNTTKWLFSISSFGYNHCWAAGMDGIILNTVNGGETWIIQENPCPVWIWSIHFVNTIHGWTGGEYGVILCTSNGGTVSINKIPSISLVSNLYPNPFKEKTTISFKTIAPSTIKLEVLDSNGNMVDVIIDKSSRQEKQQIIVKADGLASGIYYYKLTVNDQYTTGKMIVIR